MSDNHYRQLIDGTCWSQYTSSMGQIGQQMLPCATDCTCIERWSRRRDCSVCSVCILTNSGHSPVPIYIVSISTPTYAYPEEKSVLSVWEFLRQFSFPPTPCDIFQIHSRSRTIYDLWTFKSDMCCCVDMRWHVRVSHGLFFFFLLFVL